MLRLVWSPEYVDIDPDDPHNVLWPKLLELVRHTGLRPQA